MRLPLDFLVFMYESIKESVDMIIPEVFLHPEGSALFVPNAPNVLLALKLFLRRDLQGGDANELTLKAGVFVFIGDGVPAVLHGGVWEFRFDPIGEVFNVLDLGVNARPIYERLAFQFIREISVINN